MFGCFRFHRYCMCIVPANNFGVVNMVKGCSACVVCNMSNVESFTICSLGIHMHDPLTMLTNQIFELDLFMLLS